MILTALREELVPLLPGFHIVAQEVTADPDSRYSAMAVYKPDPSGCFYEELGLMRLVALLIMDRDGSLRVDLTAADHAIRDTRYYELCDPACLDLIIPGLVEAVTGRPYREIVAAPG